MSPPPRRGSAWAPRVLFLPGASGDGGFWQPLARHLPGPWERVFFDWPGLGHVPPAPSVTGFSDLVKLVLAGLEQPADLVAQSMGGVVALQVALARPDAVRRLVLTATSGGLDVAALGGEDWRPDYAREYPGAAAWIRETRVDLGDRLSAVRAPVLLLWGEADPISPVAVGEQLRRGLPRAEMVVIPAPGHMFARDRADLIAPHIRRHLTR